MRPDAFDKFPGSTVLVLVPAIVPTSYMQKRNLVGKDSTLLGIFNLEGMYPNFWRAPVLGEKTCVNQKLLNVPYVK